MNRINSRQLIVLATVVEGALLLFSLVWIYLRALAPSLELTAKTIIIGLLAAVPLYAVGIGLFLSGNRYLQSFREFRSSVLEPLVELFGNWQIAYISILAGICEETFFRGVLCTEFG